MLLGIVKHATKVCSEGADHALGNVAPLHIRWYLSVFTFPFVDDAVDVGGTGLIIMDMEVDGEAASSCVP